MFPGEGPAMLAGRDRLDLIAPAPIQCKLMASVHEEAIDSEN
jgi:hypothetical protein